MADPREDILARLVTACAGVAGINTVIRNGQQSDDTVLPCIIILDGDEVALEGEPRRSPVQMVAMTPQIFLINEDQPEDLGTQLNALRVSILKALIADATLNDLTGANGSIRYEGCATGLSRGRSMVGEMGLSVTFTYPFNPLKL